MATREFFASAHYIAQSIDLNLLAQQVPYSLILKTRNHFLFVIEKERWLFVFSFGVVVFINPTKDFLKKFLTKKVQQCCTSVLTDNYSEEHRIIEDLSVEKDAVEFDSVKVKELTLEKMEVVAEILAQSVAIDAFDVKANNALQEFSVMTTELELKGKIKSTSGTILKLIGRDHSILESMILHLSMLDKPETLWEKQELENLFNGLRFAFDLKDRFSALDYKLRFMQSNLTLMLETVRAKRDQFLEIIIIVLIVVEIVLFVYEIFGR